MKPLFGWLDSATTLKSVKEFAAFRGPNNGFRNHAMAQAMNRDASRKPTLGCNLFDDFKADPDF